ncbi:hypothetical protein M422DRAFT_269686 [Sphaerobolus stellatus SS14]|uniref:Ubiquitin-like protease family profile domain-containing protein n=1 Tax=Sphaerobolus stellatus (strain SS14) TaxID=990650 RepID=A0A0C9UJB4_SPHS4|nr:hypothetical protein M422DRAFT_269686 [Sphaerobolus stellatus SS14]
MNHWISVIIAGIRTVADRSSGYSIAFISMDSLGFDHTREQKELSDWLTHEWERHLPERPLPNIVPFTIRVPEQPNMYDCALYMIHYIDRFVRKHEQILKALKERDTAALNDPEIWRPDLAKDARKTLYVQATRHAHISGNADTYD